MSIIDEYVIVNYEEGHYPRKIRGLTDINKRKYVL